LILTYLPVNYLFYLWPLSNKAVTLFCEKHRTPNSKKVFAFKKKRRLA